MRQRRQIPDRGEEKLGFFSACLGLLLSPKQTSARLSEEGRPRYGLTILVIGILSVWLPAVAQSWYYGFNLFSSGSLLQLTTVIICAFPIFLLLESLLLHAFRTEASVLRTFGCISYSCVPAVTSLWLIYSVNLLLSGKLTFITRLILGFGELGDLFTRVIPYIFLLSAVYVVIIFSEVIQGIINFGQSSALVVTIFSMLPLSLSVMLGMLASELLIPGTIQMMMSLLGEI
ncbi:MAG: hypothetical protein EBZ48_09520 [Proteobacteria bacterium]|nr:hypothetical protein [Pseudomonadota bacterium]